MSFLSTTEESTQFQEMELQAKIEEFELEIMKYKSKINEIETKQLEFENQKSELQRQRNNISTVKEIFHFLDNTQKSNFKLEKMKIFSSEEYKYHIIGCDGTKLAVRQQSNSDILIFNIKEGKLLNTISFKNLEEYTNHLIFKLQFHPINPNIFIYIINKKLKMWYNNEEIIIDENINSKQPKISPNGNKIMYLKDGIIHIKTIFNFRENDNTLNNQEIQVLFDLQYTDNCKQLNGYTIADYFWSDNERILFIGGKANQKLYELFYYDIIKREILKTIIHSIYLEDKMEVIPNSNIIIYSTSSFSHFGRNSTKLIIKTDYDVGSSKNVNFQSNIRDIIFCTKYNLIFVVTETEFICLNLEGTILFSELKNYNHFLCCNNDNICIAKNRDIIIYQLDKIEAKFAGKKV